MIFKKFSWSGEQDLNLHRFGICSFERVELFVNSVMMFISSYRDNLSGFIYVIDKNE